MNYYNENNPFAADWLRQLMADRLIPRGDVDDRSIRFVKPADLKGYTQCHFFAGIGGWAYALQLAGWPSDRPVWTGSCPCQPFSSAGKRKGIKDARHLWPAWFRLIRQCHPAIIFGEQVASPDGLHWFDAVSDDLEGEGYAVGAADLCAAGVGAPHIRQRLWFVAHAQDADRRREQSASGAQSGWGGSAGSRRVGNGDGERLENSRAQSARQNREQVRRATESSSALADTDGRQSANRNLQRSRRHDEQPENAIAGFWGDAEWLPCIDGRSRPVEPGAFPLAYGIPARVGRLRGYGNAIVPQVAATFITAYEQAATRLKQR